MYSVPTESIKDDIAILYFIVLILEHQYYHCHKKCLVYPVSTESIKDVIAILYFIADNGAFSNIYLLITFENCVGNS